MMRAKKQHGQYSGRRDATADGEETTTHGGGKGRRQCVKRVQTQIHALQSDACSELPLPWAQSIAIQTSRPTTTPPRFVGWHAHLGCSPVLSQRRTCCSKGGETV